MRTSHDHARWLSGIIERMPAQRSSPDAHAFGYAIALTLVLVAFGIRKLLGAPELGLAYLTFFPALVLAAVFGGAGPGMLATAVGAVVATFYYLPPYEAFMGKLDAGMLLPNAVFVLSGTLVCIAIQGMHTYFRNFRETSGRLDDNGKLLQSIIDGTPDAIFVKDAAGRYRLHNQAASKMIGKPAAEVVGKDDRSIFPAATAQAMMAADRSVMAAGKATTFEERIASAAGEEIVLLTTKAPLFDECGTVTGLFGIARDVTQSKKVEAAILEKLAMQNQLAKIAATVPGVICSFKLRPDGMRCLPYASAAIEDLYGFKPEELRDDCAAMLALIHPEDIGHVRETIDLSARAMAPWHAEFRYLHPRKGFRWIEGRSMPEREPDGSILWHGFVYDVTERKQIEAELIAAKQVAEATNASKSRFLAAASHDLRQPLQAIGLFIDVLNRTTLSDEQKQIGRNLASSANALGDLLDALLDISKLDAGFVRPQRVPIGIGEVLRRADDEFSALALEKKLRFKLFLPQRDFSVDTDPKLLMSILRNVLGNAVRYTERGGLLLGVRLRRTCLALQVWDTGIGISSDHMASIYDEFFQVDNPHRDRGKGLGLGLSIVKRLAALLGYELDCRSRPGRGTVFEIRIPRKRVSVDSGRHDRAASTEDGDYACLRGRHVVVVDDDQLVVKALEIWFAAHGMKVSTYGAASDALDAAPADADFYLSDFRLPGATNGIELLDVLQRRSASPIKGLLITGDTASEQVDLQGAGRWPTLYKPVEPSKLLSALVSLQQSR